MKIRQISPDDAEAFVKLIKGVESDSPFMLFEDGERKTTIAEQRERIEKMESDRHSRIFVAENAGELIGYLIAVGGQAKRNQHSAYVVIGIEEEYRGQGVGSELFIELEKWAVTQNLHRLELNVVTRNEGGLALYRKAGFEVEGLKRHSLFIADEFVDEYYMSKLL
ncbi:GNAT family N-acetyltransferase [Pseudalkalibacillus sp. JSM 102089]|uniref:GNAT family N-acetyltransferase n=1 Tax=Pseudalkalibacillus sp. JSM 102089 TaxID=3229856 RepID=UPI0035269EDB